MAPRATRSIEPPGLQEALGGKPITDVAVPNPQEPTAAAGPQGGRASGSTMESAEARGKHLLLHFDRGLAGTPTWGCEAHGGSPSGYPQTIDERGLSSAPGAEAAELGGSHLDLRTEAELRSNPQLRSLGPNCPGDDFNAATGVQALRAADQSREIGEILLDQWVLAGIGNIDKCEGGNAWSARIDPMASPVRSGGRGPSTSRDRDRRARRGTASKPPWNRRVRFYRRAGQPCPRCGTRISSGGQGDANRTTYGCGSCQQADKPRGIIGPVRAEG